MKPPAPQARSKLSVERVITPDAGAAGERELIARAQSGDQDAFRILVERHRDRAYGLALRIVRSTVDAEEVAQDGFVRAWFALRSFRGEARFSTWLYRIVARRAFDRAAVLRRRSAREVDLATTPEPGGETPGHEAAHRARQMERLVARLPAAQRAVVTMFYYQDRSVEEVASSLGMPQGTVKTHLSRARAALREAWIREAGHRPQGSEP